MPTLSAGISEKRIERRASWQGWASAGLVGVAPPLSEPDRSSEFRAVLSREGLALLSCEPAVPRALWGLWALREYDSAPHILDRDLCPHIAMAPRRRHNSLQGVHGPARTYQAHSLPIATRGSSSAQAPCEHFLEGDSRVGK